MSMCIKGEYNALYSMIEQLSERIDDATVSADIQAHTIVSDDWGSCYQSEERKNGKIITVSMSEDSWNSTKEGQGLWEALSGDFSKYRAELKKNKSMFSVHNDPWYTPPASSKAINTQPEFFDSLPDDFSLDYMVCCLTGDSHLEQNYRLKSISGLSEGRYLLLYQKALMCLSLAVRATTNGVMETTAPRSQEL